MGLALISSQKINPMKTTRFWFAVCGLILLAQQAFAQYTLTYQTNGGTIMLTGFTGSPINVIIPNFVTAVGSLAFSNCNTLHTITIPDSVDSIGPYAFYECGSITAANIGNGVTGVEPNTFYQCSDLRFLVFGSGVTNIADDAALNCVNLYRIYFLGNAPVATSLAFNGHYPSITAYYLSGTTGWTAFSSNTSIPTKQLNGPMPMAATNAGVQRNSFGFRVTGPTLETIVIQACTNLANPVWVPLVTNDLGNGTYSFSDSAWTNYPARFYRIQYPLP